MDRRVLLALVLSAIVVVLTQIIWPAPRRPLPATAADSARAGLIALADSADRARAAATTTPPAGAATGAPAAAPTAGVPRDSVAAPAPIAADTATITTAKTTYRVSSLGAALVSAELAEYAALTPRGRKTERRVELVRRGDALLKFRLVVPGDTIALDRVPFTAQGSGTGGRAEYAATLPNGGNVTIAYTFAPDSYAVRVEGRVAGVAQPAFLIAELPRVLASAEADTLEDANFHAVAYKPRNQDAVGLPFGKIDIEEPPVVETAPIDWLVTKSKYFIVGMIADSGGTPFSEVQVAAADTATQRGFLGASVKALSARAAAVQPLPADGRFAFDLYAGPQEFERLEAVGSEFETANPYGGFLQGIVQPFSTIVMRTLLWMKRNLHLSYGWILVIFGVAVRIAIWPFQQTAMKGQIKMQRMQPHMQAIQEKYRNDPERLQKEMIKVYKDHGLSPFSAVSGCLPMLLPMPIFFALFFVFQNTIEFRGVPFLWLPDISLYDPYYILPVVMGLSSWLLAWVGMRNAPPNPQAKLMSYMFPAMMVVFLWRFASGLNLYYTVQNLAALPQQWLVARERGKAK